MVLIAEMLFFSRMIVTIKEQKSEKRWKNEKIQGGEVSERNDDDVEKTNDNDN